MLITITKKCPCSYMYKESVEVEVRTIPTTGIVTRIPGRSPLVHDMPIKQEKVLNKNVLIGGEDFKSVPFTSKEKNSDFIVCPRCGSVLLSSIATTIEKKEN